MIRDGKKHILRNLHVFFPEGIDGGIGPSPEM
jgi:hypothetical protein